MLLLGNYRGLLDCSANYTMEDRKRKSPINTDKCTLKRYKIGKEACEVMTTATNDLLEATESTTEHTMGCPSFNKRAVSYSVSYNTDIIIKHERPLEGLNVHYYPNFIRSSAKTYFQRIEKELENYYGTSPNVVKVFGKVHTIPRRQTAFGDSGTSYTFSGVTISANPWIPSILELKSAIESATNECYNFVLVNYYRNGLDYIGEHRDDETELCPNSSIASLSLGQEREFRFRHKDARGSKASRKIPPLKIFLAYGSLLLMNPPTNRFWYHSLPKRKCVTGARLNLTFRKMKI